MPEEYFYNHLSLCVIDAVWSIGVKYEGVKNVVKRYYAKRKLAPYRENSAYLEIAQQESISSFLRYVTQFSYEQLADDIFENHQRTSSTNGILKAEAVVRFATILSKYCVDYFQDITPKIENNTAFEKDIKDIPGQASGISLSYFFMLAGNENKIKPDRMIKRFLAEPIRKIPDTISNADALDVCERLFAVLRDNRITSIRQLDYNIWDYERSRTGDSVMTDRLNAKVILARCSQTKKAFGIRIEERGGDWVRTWAFPIDEHKARREKFDVETISGTLKATEEYPGCPYCKNATVFWDSSSYCGKISCSDGSPIKNNEKFTCPWCGETYGVVASKKIDVKGGGV